jgi:hypothetical protein
MSMPIGYPQAIRSLAPTAEWTMVDITNYSTLQWFSPEVTQPTESQVQAEVTRLQSEEPFTVCKEQAKKLIAASDWSVLPDVGISNVSEFQAYRAELRALIKTPVVNPSFPAEPQPVWI